MAKVSKSLKIMQKNQSCKTRKADLVAKMKKHGLDINKYWIGRDFDIDKLTSSTDIFEVGASGPQTIPLPFSDKMFQSFREMPKKPISYPITINNRNNIVHGIYLMGKDSGGRRVIFAFSIAKDQRDKYAYKNFNIKLDMLVAGKEWLPLVRFDGLSPAHPNYIVDGKVVADEDCIEMVAGPHIHLTDQATQLYTDDLSYSIAHEVPPRIAKLSQNNTQEFFQAAVNYTLSKCGLSKKILTSGNPDYLIGFNTPLFDYGK